MTVIAEPFLLILRLMLKIAHKKSEMTIKMSRQLILLKLIVSNNILIMALVMCTNMCLHLFLINVIQSQINYSALNISSSKRKLFGTFFVLKFGFVVIRSGFLSLISGHPLVTGHCDHCSCWFIHVQVYWPIPIRTRKPRSSWCFVFETPEKYL